MVGTVQWVGACTVCFAYCMSIQRHDPSVGTYCSLHTYVCTYIQTYVRTCTYMYISLFMQLSTYVRSLLNTLDTLCIHTYVLNSYT